MTEQSEIGKKSLEATMKTQQTHQRRVMLAQQLDNLPQCRICIESDGQLIRPCRCLGTAAYVHFECLSQWIQKCSMEKDGVVRNFEKVECQLCRYPFRFRSRSVEHFSCHQFSIKNGCQGGFVLELIIVTFFATGVMVASSLLATSIKKDLVTNNGKLLFSLTTICLMVTIPVLLIILSLLLIGFFRRHFWIRRSIIESIEECKEVAIQVEIQNNQEPSRQGLAVND